VSDPTPPPIDDDHWARWVALCDVLHERIVERLGDCPEMLDEHGDPCGGLCHDLASAVRDDDEGRPRREDA